MHYPNMHLKMLYVFKSVFGLCTFKIYLFEIKKLFCEIEKI